MNRSEFISDIFCRYEKFFASQEQAKALRKAYEDVLPKELDFATLSREVNISYMDTFKPPAPAFLYQKFMELNEIKNQQNKKYNMFTDGVPPTQEFLDLKAKLFRT